MSSTNPPRRRRIAGERRPSPPGAEEGTTTAPPPGPAAAPAPSPEPDAGSDGGSGTGPEVRSDKDVWLTSPGRAPEPAARARRGVPLVLLAALAVLALVLVGVAAWLGLLKYDVGEVRQASAVGDTVRTAPAAAERAAASILSYSYKSLDADAKAAQSFMTEKYAQTYGDTFDTLVRDDATRLKAQVEADVRASGVTEAASERATVLLFVNQSTTSKATPGGPQLALNRVAFDMVREGDTWLVDDIRSY